MPERSAKPAGAPDPDGSDGDAALPFAVADPGIALLTIARTARRNAFTDATVAAFARRLEAVSADSGLRVLIVTGAGRAFSAGFDLGHADAAPGQDAIGEASAWTARQEAFASIVTRLRALRVPVIAAVNGPAHGAGLGLALACEIRIAAESADFAAAFVRVGMSSCDIGVSWLLPRSVGQARAFDMMLTGRAVGAAEAERIGLVSETVPDARLLPRALEVARSIVAHDAFAIWMTKRGGWANAEAASLQAAIELENRSQILARSTGELARAAQAFKARRRGGS